MNRGSLEPWIKDDVEYYPHQVEGVRKLAFMPSFLLADDMGLGKSVQALTVFAVDVFMGRAKSGLIVCPITLIDNWIDEIEKFTRFEYEVLSGTSAKRDRKIIEFSGVTQPKLLITNYEMIPKHLKHLNALRFSAGIFDEAHYIRGYKSARTKACHSLVNGRSMLLTGTPMLNHVSDLWGLLKKIDPHNTPDYFAFMNRYARYGGYNGKTLLGSKNTPELRARMERVMLRRLKKDVLSLSEPLIIPRLVDLHPEQRAIYDQINKDMVVPRPEDADDEELEWSIVKNTRLKQVCGTTKSFNGKDISPKLDLVIDDDSELLERGKRVIIFTQFREVQECYVQRHKARHGNKYPVFEVNGSVKPGERQAVVNQWSRTAVPGVIVCMLQVAGFGLNMVASSDVAFVDKLFVPGLNRQAIDRSNRIGQTEPVTVREYMAKNTVEKRVEIINRTKDEVNDEVIEASPAWQREILRRLIELEEAEEAKAA